MARRGAADRLAHGLRRRRAQLLSTAEERVHVAVAHAREPHRPTARAYDAIRVLPSDRRTDPTRHVQPDAVLRSPVGAELHLRVLRRAGLDPCLPPVEPGRPAPRLTDRADETLGVAH